MRPAGLGVLLEESTRSTRRVLPRQRDGGRRQRTGSGTGDRPRCNRRSEGANHEHGQGARAAEDVADELDAAVIALGSRDLKGMKKILGGSVSQQVAEHAGRPVPIVPPR